MCESQTIGHTIFAIILYYKGDAEIMAKFIVEHSENLSGCIKISGSKNAVLPILAASILTEKECLLHQVPALTDVYAMITILENLGATVTFDTKKETLKICSGVLKKQEEEYELAEKMRASFLIMGPLLAKYKQAKIPLPGGCPIGTRPVDLHLKGFLALGCKIKQEHGYIDITTKGLKGANIYLDFPSVGATENIMMAATLANGVTMIQNAAAEPEISDLAAFLKKMGADIEGEGTDTIVIRGVKELNGTEHTIIPDRIEAGTFMTAAAITNGDIILENINEEHLKPIIAKLSETNVKIEMVKEGLRIYRKGKLQPIHLKTMPFPGFPTDMQAPFMSLMTMIKGTSLVTETVFENRFQHVSELKRMGANIKIESRSAVIEGVDKLTGSQVKATDLRAGAALILSALAAEGKTEISDIYHVERGYYKIEEKLKSLGAKILRCEDDNEES
jgi:UDP-N-acetylglucosamine 1-carboxyvinyltransferase